MELERLYTGYRNRAYDDQRLRLEPAYEGQVEQFSNTESRYFKARRAFYDDFQADRFGLQGLVVDAGDGEGYFGRYAYPHADVVTLARTGETPGVVVSELMAAADVLFMTHSLQQSPRPLATLTQLTQAMRPGAEAWLEVPIQYTGSMRASFKVEQVLAARGLAPCGPLTTLHENVSHYSAHSLRRLCVLAGLLPLEIVKSSIGVLAVLARRTAQPLGELSRLAPSTDQTHQAPPHRPAERSRRSLLDLGHEQPFELDTLGTARAAALALPAEWERLWPESAATHVHVSPTLAAPLSRQDDAVTRLRAELDRQDAQLAEIYASISWRITGWMRRLAVRPRRSRPQAHAAPTLELDARLDLSEPEAAAFLPRGFSGAEAWGRWTDGATAVFRCRHAARDGPGELEVWPHMLWSRESSGPVSLQISVNGERRRPIAVEVGVPIKIPIPSKVMAEPQLDVAFHIADPKRPDEEPTAEARRLGVGIAAIRLRFVDLSPLEAV